MNGNNNNDTTNKSEIRDTMAFMNIQKSIGPMLRNN